MKNPFNPQNLGEAKLKRNVFDLGRNSIFTNDFFKLYPFFCQEIIPGDTVRIDAQIGVRGMPTVFPVQTKCRASMEFYYVRNRTLMDNFEDYIFMTKDIEAPWLRLNEERAKKMISVGSLGDAFNVPTTTGVDSDIVLSTNVRGLGPVYSFNREFWLTIPDFNNNVLPSFVNALNNNLVLKNYNNVYNQYFCYFSGDLTLPLKSGFTLSSSPFRTTLDAFVPSVKTFVFLAQYVVDSESATGYGYKPISLPVECTINPVSLSDGLVRLDYAISDFDKAQLVHFSSDFLDNGGTSYCIGIGSYEVSEYSSGRYAAADNPPYFVNNGTSSSLIPTKLDVLQLSSGVYDATDDSIISNNPFVGDNPDIRLNALPFRAYEMICNYYYRNDKNNPYVLNGESQYNEFIPTHEDGPDDNLYDYHFRNWELDRFTSAIQSPQFGEAPLVGLTYSPTSPTADLTFQGSIDGGDTRDYSVKVGINEDGGIDSIVDFDSDVPSANLQRLQRQIQAGISINDLRITNSFQRFLENTIRRGLRYRNQLKSHFGVSVDYPDIDVPQYIGGVSGFLESGQVTNMADSPNAGLGDYVGTLQGGISMRNKITHYCTEHGFIIGIFSIAPIPNYPQSISKVMIKTNPLDYYHPEFGKIGYVPIHYSELMPLQTPTDGSVDDVFAYQKANYDYMQAFDEVHGDFRTNLRDFALSRTFKERPLLSESFTVGHPEQLNDIWVANNIADAYNSTAKFMCSSHVSCIMKREVAVVGTPSLE